MSPSLLAQQILNRTANPRLVEDGVFGPRSIAEARKQIPWTFRGQPNASRWVAAIIQKEAREKGYDAGQFDAFWGPQTQAAYEQLIGLEFERPDEKMACPMPPAAAVRCWYPRDSQLIQRYGQPGSNQVRAQSPFPLKLDWDLGTTITSFSCHRLVKEEVEAIFNSILRHYGPERIRQLGIDRFGGCLNVRKKRGGSTWSTHAWGTAIDLYPSQNQMRWGRDRAAFARPEYRPLLDIFRHHGWMSLGECANFDWMHWQRNP